ncbi:Pycsar system effector family protein [Flavobacterium sp.]|uniref:Pycsar system effector family protein n=1 Tax=Flavobacterium sp. TaxID=239 RepID=UPI003753A72E
MNKSEKERLIFNVGRFDHYYDTINNKIAVYIAINTFLLGGVLGAYFTINSKIVNHAFAFEFLIGLFTFMGLTTVAVLIYASVPFLNYKSSSLYYFGTIAQNTLEEYKEKSKERDTKEDLKDLREQVYFLSKGLNKKFTILKWIGYSMLFQVIVLVFVAIIIFNNTI